MIKIIDKDDLFYKTAVNVSVVDTIYDLFDSNDKLGESDLSDLDYPCIIFEILDAKSSLLVVPFMNKESAIDSFYALIRDNEFNITGLDYKMIFR